LKIVLPTHRKSTAVAAPCHRVRHRTD
jgi:hypothetical protein